MSRRRELKGLAYNVAQKFACSAEHFAWLAVHHKEPAVTIDLFSLQISPDVFDIERNRILADQCQKSLVWFASQIIPVEIRAAVLAVSFDIENVEPDGKYAWMAKTVFTVSLTDDMGRTWVGVLDKNHQFVCP